MKKDLSETVSLIEQAVRSLNHDFAVSNVRGLLLSALRECKHVSKKRQRREQNAMQEMAQKAKTMHDDWWGKIQENVRLKAKEDAEKPVEDLQVEQ